VRHNLLEETYEVLEAIDAGDMGKLREELGDLLMLVLFHIQMAAEAGDFTLPQVVAGISEKLVRRHPHVFGGEEAGTAEEVLHRWEEIKTEEKNGQRESILEGTPKALPALLRAHRLQDRAARVGFDWSGVSEVVQKVEEEWGELTEAMGSGDPRAVEHELGDLLFALVNLSRFMGINPDQALARSTDRFVRRFREIEAYAARNGRALHTLSLEEMDRVWNRAKEAEGK